MRPRWNPAAPRRIDPQSNILTAPQTNAILADGGTIIDDPSPTPSCCCGCPPCYVPRTGEEMCACIPTEFLIVVSGVTVCNCIIFDNALAPPHEHFETDGDPNGTYCTRDADIFGNIPVGITGIEWGNDSDPACPEPDCCGPPASLIGGPAQGSISGGASGFGAIIDVDVDIGVLGTSVFHAHATSTNCDGPWVVSNQNGACGYSPTSTITGHGGVAVVYACAC